MIFNSISGSFPKAPKTLKVLKIVNDVSTDGLKWGHAPTQKKEKNY